MNTQLDLIRVTSHVSRDLEQNAAYFNTFEKIVWEYISNSLDAAKENELSQIDATINRSAIVVKDNGIGMSRQDLSNFFQMHGKNIHRMRGKRVRGRFGTGKSAAFGLAKSLTIDTARGGLRNVVRLTRDDIKAASDGDPIPVHQLTSDEATSAADGTTIKIESFLSRKGPKVEKVIKYVERHLSRYKGRAQVKINGHLCKSEEPGYRHRLEREPPPHVHQHTGDILLVMKVANKPLNAERMGIDILSHGLWHATTTAGIEHKERAEYIFGEVEVPILEDGDWDIPPFDNTRGQQLNEQNPVVATLLGWISEELQTLREELVREAQKQKQTEQARRLAREARRIAQVLNEDFAQQELQLERARKLQTAQQKQLDEAAANAEIPTPGDGDTPTGLQEAGASQNGGGQGEGSNNSGDPPAPSLIEGEELGSPKRTEPKSKRRRRPVFSLEYENITPDEPRSRYDGAEKTIYINLDHRQIESALKASKGKTTGKPFREMCYEVAAVEYAIALEHVRVDNGEVEQVEDALYNFRKTIDRIMNRIAPMLYGEG